MPETVSQTVRALLEQMQQTIEELLALGDGEIPQPSSHVCAQGRDLWALLTNDIDHEIIHAGQVLEARYEARITPSPMARLAGEWLQARAKFISALAGLSDDQYNSETAPGAWTYRQVASHLLKLEEHSLQTVRADIAARGAVH